MSMENNIIRSKKKKKKKNLERIVSVLFFGCGWLWLGVFLMVVDVLFWCVVFAVIAYCSVSSLLFWRDLGCG